MKKVIYVKNGTWWEHEGTMESAKEIEGTYHHEYFSGSLGELTRLAQRRPNNYFDIGGHAQWAIDKSLGILDWDGDPQK